MTLSWEQSPIHLCLLSGFICLVSLLYILGGHCNSALYMSVFTLIELLGTPSIHSVHKDKHKFIVGLLKNIEASST